MEPVLNDGEYVFCTIPDADLKLVPREITICEFKENEGITIILSKEDALKHGLSFDYVASWITLNIHSSLEAVGLTAAFSAELSKYGISCNVVAGYYHDHLFVDKKDGSKAIKVLQDMTGKNH